MILERSKALQAENTTLRMEKERLSSDLSLTKENLADRINEGEQQAQLISELEDHVEKLQVCTQAPINLPIPVIAYFINTLDSQSSGRGRGGPNYFKVGGLFKKICTSIYANFRKKISSDTSCGRSQTLP